MQIKIRTQRIELSRIGATYMNVNIFEKLFLKSCSQLQNIDYDYSILFFTLTEV